MKRGILLVLFLMVSVTLANCGGKKEAPAAETISVVMHDIYYGESNDNTNNPPAWAVTSGAEVTLNVDNQGALQHNWAIVKSEESIPQPFMVDQHKGILLFDAGVVDAGKTSSTKFTAPAAGEYTIICTVAGHYPVMQGKLQVK
jgi:uncharacterized cupredoxin-like copper-binding protein